MWNGKYFTDFSEERNAFVFRVKQQTCLLHCLSLKNVCAGHKIRLHCIHPWFLHYTSSKISSDVIGLLPHYFTTKYPPKSRHLSYRGTDFIPFSQKSVSRVIRHRVTTVATWRSSSNLWQRKFWFGARSAIISRREITAVCGILQHFFSYKTASRVNLFSD